MGPEERESIEEPVRRLFGEHREAMAGAGAHAEHVDDETLARHASGDLPSPAALEVAKHVATCDSDCADRLRAHAASVHATREGLYPEVAPTSAVARRVETATDTESAAPPKVSERTHPGKSVRSFVARDVLWEMFEQMARELECSVDYLMNESMKLYMRHRSGARTPAPGRASVPPSSGAKPDPTAPSLPPMAAAAMPPVAAGPVATAVPVGTPHTPGPVGTPHTPGPVGTPHTPASVRSPLPSSPQSRPSGPPPLPPTSRPSGPPPMPPLSVRPTVPAPPPSYGGPPPAFGTPPPPVARAMPGPMDAPRITPGPFPAARPQYEGMQPAPPPPPPPPPMQMQMQQAPPPMPGYGQMLPHQYGPGPAGTSLSAYYAGQRHVVSKDRFIIGRGKNTTDLTVRDPNISRQHAMVEYSDGVYYMVDLGSTNGVEHIGSGGGTPHPGQRIARKAIAEGDLFVICGHEIRFSYR